MQNKIITHINFAKGFRGGERQTQITLEELSKLGYKQKLIVRKKSELPSRCQGIKNLEIIEISKPYIFNFRVVKDSDLLHAHETKALQFAYLCNMIYKIPYIVTRRVDNKLKTNFLNTLMYAKASYSVAVSSVIEKEILRVSCNANTTVVLDSFTSSEFNETQAVKIQNKFKNKFIIGHIGALDDKHKGQSFLIDVAKSIELSHPNIHFVFLGRGEDEQSLKEQAKDLANITFEGFVDNVNDYIKCFDLFVFPSRNEGLGSILLDVMQFNVPIIASDVGGIPDIITNNENGILVSVGDVDSIEENIIDLYNNQSKREFLASNARKNIELYSPENMASQYSKIYKSIIV